MSDEAKRLVTSWQAQLLRLTVFLVGPLEARVAETLWHHATGEQPEVDENRPREGIRRQVGPFGGDQLDIQMSPARVDWIMAPRIEPTTVTLPVTFVSLAGGIADFSEAALRWLRTESLSIKRIAVGAIFFQPASNKLAAYQLLRDCLKSVQVDPENSAELFYQINWPLWSRVMPNMRINRITKWSAMSIRGVNFEMAPNEVRSVFSGQDDYCRLECDHSTAEDRVEAIDPIGAERLFRELCGLVSENAEAGEITAKNGPL